MKPSDFRRIGYTRKLNEHKKSNNFYNGKLKLSFLNSHNIPNETEIYKMQKQMVQTYCGTLKKQKILNGINIDILNTFYLKSQNFNQFSDTIVNNINQEIDNMVINYGADMSAIRKMDITNYDY